LVAEGYAVRILDSRRYPYPPPEGAFEAIIGELTALSDIQHAARDCQGIVHLAAVSRVLDGYRHPWQCIATNVIGTANVLESARQASEPPWILLGSTREVPANLDPHSPIGNLYVATKFSAELLAHQYGSDYGLRILAVRFSDVYGSARDNPDKVLPQFVEQARRREPLVVRDPTRQLDFTFYEDVVRGIVLGVEYLAGCRLGVYESISLCTGRTLTVQRLAETVVAELGSTSLIKVGGHPVFTDNHLLGNDTSRALELLGFRAQVPFREGLRRLLAVPSGKLGP